MKRIGQEMSKKRNCNEGQEYTTAKGKMIRAKTLQPPCNCRMKCADKVSEIQRASIFADYYSLCAEEKNQFIAGSIEEGKKQCQRLRRNDEAESRRKFTRHYFLPNASTRVEVCQKMFTNTLDITLKKVRVITEKKRSSGSDICASDGRGKHQNHQCISEVNRDVIREHIRKFPAYESHYSRSHTAKKYLAPDQSISRMYRLYKKYCEEQTLAPQSEFLYREIFVKEFNLQFKNPRNGACAKCDKHTMIIKTSEGDEDRSRAEEVRKQHMDKAEAAYNEKRSDKNRSKELENIVTLSFDLEKCLLTPLLQNGLSFYKRQLWTYNLTFYETRKGQ